MTQEQFDSLVHRLEKFSKLNPKGYQARVRWLARLGYFYIFGMLILLLVLAALCVWLLISAGRLNRLILMIIVALLFVAFTIVRSLWVKIDPLEGIPLERHHAPELFAFLDEAAKKLKAPRFHRAIITGDYNAAMREHPRFGILGGYVNQLKVGLPLMYALSPEQFKAVLAHEYGHLSSNHSKFGGYIYRMSYVWEQLDKNLQEQSGGNFLFDWFFDWYAPYYQAYTFVLRRQNEYTADKVSAELTSPQIAAEALILTDVYAGYFEGYHQRYFNQARDLPYPTVTPLTEMPAAIKSELSELEAQSALKKALDEPTGTKDTHPNLADRLKGIGYLQRYTRGGQAALDLMLPKPPSTSAAEYFLGGSLPVFAQQLDRQWQAEAASTWQQVHEKFQQARMGLSALEQKAVYSPLPVAEQVKRARLTEQLKSYSDALPLWVSLASINPDDADIAFYLGRALLRQEVPDPQGLAYLERAMSQEPSWTMDACHLIYNYWHTQNEPGRAEPYKERAIQYYEQAMAAEQERATFNDQDILLPHGLSPQELEPLIRAFAAYEMLEAVYLVRKQVQVFADKPMFVLGVLRKGKRFEPETRERIEWTVRYLSNTIEATGFPYEYYISISNDPDKLRKRFEQVEHSLVYWRRS